MKLKIIEILSALIMCLTLTSCLTTQAQNYDTYDNGIDVGFVVKYGTPFYSTEGILLYYVYKNMFYYPYYYNNKYYLYRHYKPIPTRRFRPYRPITPRNFHNYNSMNRRHMQPNGSTHHTRPNNRLDSRR